MTQISGIAGINREGHACQAADVLVVHKVPLLVYKVIYLLSPLGLHLSSFPSQKLGLFFLEKSCVCAVRTLCRLTPLVQVCVAKVKIEFLLLGASTS